MSNIVDVVVADNNLATMSRSMKVAELDKALKEKGPFTILAPTDLAFGKLRAGRLQELQQPENREKLTELLSHHLVNGVINFKDFKNNQKLITISGRELTVKIADGKVSINGAVLQGRDNVGSNGVVHSLDTVLEMK